MHILAGRFKRTPILSPKDARSHPMGAREKNALFNRLEPILSGATVLDAFAGSGALGLEALSRGAKSCVFIEKSPKVAQILSQNLATAGPDVVKNTTVIVKNVSAYETSDTLDLVIADPPYDAFDPAPVQHLATFLKPGGILALSHPKPIAPPDFAGLELLDSHTYAGATLSLFKKL